MRALGLKSIPNAADLGGAKGLNGRTVRTGMLLRASKPDAPAPEDARLLRERYRVKTVIDLRTEKEAAAQPDAAFGGVYCNIPLRPDVKAGVKYDFPSTLKTYAKKFPSMPQMYADMLTSAFSTAQLQKIFSIIFEFAQKDECVLFHCTEGKDRTGIVAALTELLLGVDREEIMRNYLRSNECFKKRNRRYYVLTVIGFMDVAYAKEFKMMFEAHPYMMNRLFEIVDGFGGVDAYFTGRLGFSPAALDSFREKMLT
jgi:protein-tyrosine phosphatase